MKVSTMGHAGTRLASVCLFWDHPSLQVPPLITPIIADLNMSYSQMGLVLGSCKLTFIAAAAFAGAALEKWPIRVSLFFGILVDWIRSFHAAVFYVSTLSLVIFALTFLLKDIGDPAPDPS